MAYDISNYIEMMRKKNEILSKKKKMKTGELELQSKKIEEGLKNAKEKIQEKIASEKTCGVAFVTFEYQKGKK
jgi:ABC-type Zn uptake system ZnuABC Zn-binding protein ZnuA